MDNMSKTLFITNRCVHYRKPLFEELSKNNVDFLFTAEDKRPFLNSKIIKGIGIRRMSIHLNLFSFITDKKYSKIIMLPPDPSNLIDNLFIYIFCRLYRKPYIIWTERWKYKEIAIKDKISNIFYLPIIKQATKIIVPGTKAKKFILSYGISKDKIILIQNASEIEYDADKTNDFKEEIKKKYMLENKKVILYVGRIIKIKGLNYLIDAMTKIKDKNTVLLIVGGGDFYKLGEPNVTTEIINQIKQNNLNDRVILIGEINHKLLPAYFLLSDIFVYPSVTLKRGDAWGLSINEAMQFGLPIVTTTAVGCSEDLVKNGYNGYVVPEKNSKALSLAIINTLQNSKIFGKNSKKIIKNYTYDKMLISFINTLK